MSQTTNTSSLVMEKALEAYLRGEFQRDDLLHILKWEMAASEEWIVLGFIAHVEDLDVDGGLAHAVRRTYEYVRLWEFPEEQGLSRALPEAVEATLPELILSVAGAFMQLCLARDMLAGLNIRLDLRDSEEAFGAAVDLLGAELEILEQACETIGNHSYLASELPEDEAAGRPAWTAPNGGPLSPKEILRLSHLARRMMPIECVTYEEGLRAHSTPPQLVTERIIAREQRQSE